MPNIRSPSRSGVAPTDTTRRGQDAARPYHVIGELCYGCDCRYVLHQAALCVQGYSLLNLVGSAKKDHATLRALSALIASLPASENKEFREEFDTEYEDVQLTAYLATLTKSANILNDVRSYDS